jgi:hypothetical protein
MATRVSRPGPSEPDHGPALTCALIQWAEARRRGDPVAEQKAVEALRELGVYVLVHLRGGRSGASHPNPSENRP